MAGKISSSKNFGAQKKRRGALSPTAQTLVAVLSITIITYAYKYRPITAIEYIFDGLAPTPPEEIAEPTPPPAQKVYGEKTPKGTVLALISELKSSQDPTAALNYVWWDSAFAKLNDTQRKYLSVRSPQSLRRFYQEMFTSPNMFLFREAARHLSDLPPDRRQQLIDMLKSQEGVSVPPPPYNRILNQLFEIKKETISGDTAEVELSILENRVASSERIELIKVQDRWMLSCFEIVEDPLRLCAQQ
ncbi:MAG: hypothetical protein U0136_16895 [Bdellovibrionota bacterium]